ncbi:MAG: hemerythrin domain-containing protein [Betaproteobacteria bacterium]|nr:hemerythrin domain-containing protein [Betaproteobacteria bacterium]
MKPALPIIEAEHRTLGKLLRGLKTATDDLVAGRQSSDVGLLGAIVRYIGAYPERYHHPKETRHLFNRLRMRTTEFDVVLDRLERDHLIGEAMLSGLSSALRATENGGDNERKAFARNVNHFAEFYWEHMRIEEELILPAARRLFTEDDWDDLDCAFAGHVDPLADMAERTGNADFAALLARLDTDAVAR